MRENEGSRRGRRGPVELDMVTLSGVIGNKTQGVYYLANTKLKIREDLLLKILSRLRSIGLVEETNKRRSYGGGSLMRIFTATKEGETLVKQYDFITIRLGHNAYTSNTIT